VRDSDTTVLFSIDPVSSGGSTKTVEFARKHNKPCLHLHSSQRDAADSFESFRQDNGVQILNVDAWLFASPWTSAQFVTETFDSVFRF
jgi:hypothetical protein